MPRPLAITILAGFALFGLVVAGWGLWDIAAALTALSDCAGQVILDSSAFWFLAMAVLPLFLLLARLDQRNHTRLLAGIVALAITLPAGGFVMVQHRAATTGHSFVPPLTLFALREVTAARPPACDIDS